MRKTLGAILTLAYGLAATALAADKPQPKIVVPAPIHDFGTVEKSMKLGHDFELRNEGSAPLLIREARPDCACAVASFDKTIAPGATGKLHVDFDPADMLGPIRKTVVVYTNDPAAPEVHLTIAAVVQPALAMKPGYARYIYVQKEQAGVVTQTVWARDGADFRVLEVKSPYPFLKTAFWEATPEERLPDQAGKQWKITTTLDPESPVGPLEKAVEVITDHPRHRQLELPVSGFVRPVVAVTPPTADLGTRKRGEPFRGTLKVQTFATEPIAVTEVTTDVRGLVPTLETVTEGRVYRVALAFSDDIATGPFSGKLKITTASPKAPVVEVPLSGTIE
jgi:hypothetical protein